MTSIPVSLFSSRGLSSTNVLLADEINRTIPRTQSSLLEAMEEHQVTVDGKPTSCLALFGYGHKKSHRIEGTFPLPEAQLDRFLLRVRLGYPEQDEKIAILERFQPKILSRNFLPLQLPQKPSICSKPGKRHVSPALREYITSLVRATRNPSPSAWRKPQGVPRTDAISSGPLGTQRPGLRASRRYQDPGHACACPQNHSQGRAAAAGHTPG